MANSQVTVRDTQLEKQRTGFMSLSFTNFANTSEPQIAAGSVVEVGGSLYVFSANESISGWSGISNNTDAYIKLTPGASDVSASFVTTAPTWSAAKQGWYSGDDRYIGGLHRGASSAAYEGKYLYQHFNANSEAHMFYADGSIDIANSNFTINSDGAVVFNGDFIIAYGMQNHSLLASLLQHTTGLQDITFSSDGTSLYEVNSLDGNVAQSTLSTAWDLSTATFNQTGTLKDQIPKGVAFNSDGTKMFTITNSDTKVNEYPLSTAWDVSTLGAVSTINAQDASPQGLAFNSDGTKLYEIGYSGTIYESNLTTGWDLSTATFSQSASLTGSLVGIDWRNDGKALYIGDDASDVVTEYIASTAWDISTLSKRRSISAPGSVPHGVTWGDSGKRFFIYDSADSEIDGYYPQ